MTRFLLLGCAALLAASFVTSSALAQDDRRPLLYARHHNYESPENFAVQIGVAPFTPDIDSDPSLNGATPFKDTFPSAHPLRLGAEFDWEGLRIPHVGTIGPGLGIGYVNISGNAPVTNPTPGGPTTSGETTTLELYPFYAVAVFRADGPWKDHGVPFVPYAKLGLATTLWRASNTLGTSHFRGRAGEGYTLGTQATLGLAFVLNILDPYAAKQFDESMGVNSTSIFAEWTNANLDGLFLQSDPLRVGGRYWTFGMAFTF